MDAIAGIDRLSETDNDVLGEQGSVAMIQSLGLHQNQLHVESVPAL